MRDSTWVATAVATGADPDRPDSPATPGFQRSTLRELAVRLMPALGPIATFRDPAGFTYLGQFTDHDLTIRGCLSFICASLLFGSIGRSIRLLQAGDHLTAGRKVKARVHAFAQGRGHQNRLKQIQIGTP